MPTASATRQAKRMAAIERQVPHRQRGGEGEAGEGHHRADRQVELARHHEQRRAHREDAELGGGGHEVHHARQREHGAGGCDEEEHGDDDEAGQRAQLGAAQQARCKPGLRDALVARGIAVRPRGAADAGPFVQGVRGRHRPSSPPPPLRRPCEAIGRERGPAVGRAPPRVPARAGDPALAGPPLMHCQAFTGVSGCPARRARRPGRPCPASPGSGRTARCRPASGRTAC